jgi:hypothetical protein
VVTSNCSSLPEIAGHAALLVDPGSVEALTEAIGRLATDAALRARYRQRGLERAELAAHGGEVDPHLPRQLRRKHPVLRAVHDLGNFCANCVASANASSARPMVRSATTSASQNDSTDRSVGLARSTERMSP